MCIRDSCTITRKSFGSILAADILTPRENLESLWKILLEKTKAAGGGPIGYAALSALRLEQGIPWFSYDFGEKQIPHEAGLQGTHISYTKGCYTGQEIVDPALSSRMAVPVKARNASSSDSFPVCVFSSAGEPVATMRP